jgi:inositol-1,3,4-trisphosphate 5/6-kinase/inositol-tetrakisphosphate 1-kinase
MVIVFSPEGFADVKPPVIVQQFVDHDATFLKVYVLDGEVMYSTRRSLPNYQQMKNALLLSGTHCIPFDSRCPFPTLSDCGKIAGVADRLPDTGTESEMGSSWRASSDIHSRIECAAQSISDEFGLTLFGFDIIVASNKESREVGSQMLVIDVNFFPSYKEVPDFPTKLRAYLRRAAGLGPWNADVKDS